ncbi:BofC C-terminal domain-containing protein [Shouchella sp. JSM 1781072]|uniref:BofC C-terminal domain-containing protein n=1 Tax=Shouchella sp. JSM 1781072 TaxID=3344581 RepID=UPI0035BF2B54
MYKHIITKHWIPFTLGAFSVILFYSTFIIWNESKPVQQPPNVASEQIENEVELLLETVFADGVSREVIKKETVDSMSDFWYEYGDWQMVDQKKGFVHFKQEIVDLSPEVKQNGYLGISEENELILYTGQPEAKEIVQTYNQMGTYELTESERAALTTGLKVSSVEALQAVIGS